MRMIFERPASGTELVRSLAGPNPPATVEIRFEPLSPTDRLTGLPTAWCNAPSIGQALVYNVPVTQQGTTTGTLTVSSPASGTATNIPVRIKHDV